MSNERPGHPHAQSAVARYLTRRIDELRGVKTQREIAAAAGFARPNVVSMLKTGETQLPLARIPALARALDADPAHLFRLGMIDQWPELAPVIEECFGKQLATQNEFAIFLAKWRMSTADMDPAPNAAIEAAVDELLKALFGRAY